MKAFICWNCYDRAVAVSYGCELVEGDLTNSRIDYVVAVLEMTGSRTRSMFVDSRHCEACSVELHEQMMVIVG